MAAEQQRRLPTESLECRQRAERLLAEGDPVEAIAWALLAIAAEGATIRRALGKGR